MKPHRLAFCALGPYADEVEIDFDPLVEEGLFLIHGPTGAGKTFLLDALCYALYGDVPGERGRHTVRSDHAPLDVSTWAELEFTSQGHRWRVRRSPEHEAAKVRGEGTTRRLAEATLERREGDEWRAVAGKIREVNDEIAGLLGLTAEQFQQVILLPQVASSGSSDPTPRTARNCCARSSTRPSSGQHQSGSTTLPRAAGKQQPSMNVSLRTYVERPPSGGGP